MDDIKECIEDIVNKVSVSQTEIIKAKSLDNKLIIINISEFKNNHYLDGANVFKILFKIGKSDFADIPLEKDDNNYITLLSELSIYADEWYQFISFIKNGFPSKYIKEKISDHFITKLEKLNETCNKLGGIPSFDHFYRNFYKEINKEAKLYNPLRANQDYLKLYNWRVIKEESFNNDIMYKDWSSTDIERIGITDYIWLRKKKE